MTSSPPPAFVISSSSPATSCCWRPRPATAPPTRSCSARRRRPGRPALHRQSLLLMPPRARPRRWPGSRSQTGSGHRQPRHDHRHRPSAGQDHADRHAQGPHPRRGDGHGPIAREGPAVRLSRLNRSRRAGRRAGCGGCGLGPGSPTKGVSVTVTGRFGTRHVSTVSRSKVPGSETVMRMLERSFKISTRYGGGFVRVHRRPAPSGGPPTGSITSTGCRRPRARPPPRSTPATTSGGTCTTGVPPKHPRRRRVVPGAVHQRHRRQALPGHARVRHRRRRRVHAGHQSSSPPSTSRPPASCWVPGPEPTRSASSSAPGGHPAEVAAELSPTARARAASTPVSPGPTGRAAAA